MLNNHNSFEEMIADAGEPLPRITAKQAASMLLSDDITEYDRKLITSAVAELAHTAQMFKHIRQRPKVTIFGSARTKPDHPDYITCKEFAKQLAQLDYMVITGAGPGIMAAGNEGAGPDHAIGVNISLPFEQGVNEFIAQSKYLVTYRYFFNRKLTFVREADAVVICPGGFGSMDEAFEVLTLIQTGRAMPVPFILLEHEGSNYWAEWERYVKEVLLKGNHISDDDMYLFRRFTDPAEAVDYIHNFYRRYHSLRYIGDKVVIRLNTRLPQSLLETLRKEYADFAGEFGIQESDALPEEQDEPDLLKLPRLIVKADRKNPVGLYLLIRSLNREVLRTSTRRQDRKENVTRAPRPRREKVKA